MSTEVKDAVEDSKEIVVEFDGPIIELAIDVTDGCTIVLSIDKIIVVALSVVRIEGVGEISLVVL